MKLTKLNPKSNFEQELKFKSVEKDGQGNWWWSVRLSWRAEQSRLMSTNQTGIDSYTYFTVSHESNFH